MPGLDIHATGERVDQVFADRIKGKTGKFIVTGVSPGGFGADTARVLALYGAKHFIGSRIKATAKWRAHLGWGTCDKGAYLSDCKIATDQAAPHVTDKETAKWLWALSEKVVGQKFDA
ncbi:hypothetical protein C8R43DRAFT_952405 [Mycena crocata]|nr:hypothetical protein C8R43DRAFT_952405 [Mycena crocata]